MKARAVTGVVLMVSALAGCGPSTPEPPKKICDVPMPSELVKPFMAEGEQVEEDRSTGSMPWLTCTVTVDDEAVFHVRRDDDGKNYGTAGSGTGQPVDPRDFSGSLEMTSYSATAVAFCGGKDDGVSAYGYVNHRPTEGQSDGENRQHLQDFINAYMPGVLKHYGCKS